MSTETKAIIKINDKETRFSICRDKEVLSEGSVRCGQYHIIGDVHNCLRLSREEAKKLIKTKGVCTLDERDNTKEELLAQIISARVNEIFKYLKIEIIKTGIFNDISCFLIAKSDDYIPNMDKLVSKVMDDKPVECVGVSMTDLNFKV